jgi:hypothetical protein
MFVKPLDFIPLTIIPLTLRFINWSSSDNLFSSGQQPARVSSSMENRNNPDFLFADQVIQAVKPESVHWDAPDVGKAEAMNFRV